MANATQPRTPPPQHAKTARARGPGLSIAAFQNACRMVGKITTQAWRESMLRPAAILIIACLFFFSLPSARGQARLKAGETVETQGKLDLVCTSRENAIQ